MENLKGNVKVPLVSICIPSFNKAKYIGQTLKSIYAQTYKNIELIIIDDCSTDDSNIIINTVLKDCPFKYIYKKNIENQGVCAVANKGVGLSTGKYFQFLGSDDIILPNKIKHQVALLEASNEDVAFIYSPTVMIDENGLNISKSYFSEIGFKESIMPSGNIFFELLKVNFIPSPTTLIKLDCIKSVGGYNEKLKVEDWEMALLLSKKYKVLFDNTITANYRVINNSLMHSQKNTAIIYDSLCSILLRHAYEKNKFDKIIFAKISQFAPIIYANSGPSAKKWFIKSLPHSFTIKNLIYTLSAIAGIKYNSLKKWKMVYKGMVI